MWQGRRTLSSTLLETAAITGGSMDSSRDEKRPVEFRTLLTVNLYVTVNERPVAWIAPFLRSFARPINSWLAWRRIGRWKKSEK